MKLGNIVKDAKTKELLRCIRMLRMKHFKTINRLYDGFATVDEFQSSNMELIVAERELWKHIRFMTNEGKNDQRNK